VVHNAAFDIPILHRYGVVVPWENIWDTMLSGYILGVEQLGLKARALRELNISMETFEEVGGGEYDSSKISLERLVPYCGADAAIAYRLYEKDLQSIKDNNAEDIFSVEMQLLPILLEISRRGVKVNTEKLRLFGVDLDYDLSEQVHKIHELTGYAFNVNSSEQLADVLFTKLKIKPRRRTKGKGHGSTDKESLVALQKHHPVIKEIIEYRSLAKLKGTYVDGLLDAVDPGGRIHTTSDRRGPLQAVFHPPSRIYKISPPDLSVGKISDKCLSLLRITLGSLWTIARLSLGPLLLPSYLVIRVCCVFLKITRTSTLIQVVSYILSGIHSTSQQKLDSELRQRL
jgi:DNA polymerase-1